ncbi:MAG: hypothetical protein M3R57_07330 [Chloroflexota bacterium]|nr:hypothetical protein [Chloroflexota bacterium]
MRAMSFFLADLAFRVSERPERPVPEPVEPGPIWTPERAAAWRAWATRGARAEHAPAISGRTGLPKRIEAPSRPRVVETARAIRQSGRASLFRFML